MPFPFPTISFLFCTNSTLSLLLLNYAIKTTLLHLPDEILKNMDEKRISVLVLLDMTKAFDSIRHNILLAKLHRIGISSSALAWFSSYLSSRKKVGRIWNILSEQLEVTFIVTQGFILGPVLFTLYVNELLSIPNHCQSMVCVDRPNLLALPPNQIIDVVSMLDDYLREITKWYDPDRTKSLVIGVPQLTKTLPALSVTVLEKNVEPVTTARDLGVYSDNSLNYNDHIDKISSSCIYKVIMIKSIKHLLDLKTISYYYFRHSFVFNLINYSIALQCGVIPQDMRKTLDIFSCFKSLQQELSLAWRNPITSPRDYNH